MSHEVSVVTANVAPTSSSGTAADAIVLIGIVAERKKLCPRENDSLEAQFKRFATLRRNEPERCKKIYEDGEALVSCASKGQLSKLRGILDSLDKDDILIYHIHKMFVESLVHGYFMVSDYILDHGYPYRSLGVPPALHECLLFAAEDARAQEITEFLCVKKRFDINFQEGKDWMTALHIAVRRQFIVTVSFMLSVGADVNAIARHDVMPLNLAETADDSSIHKSAIVQLLLDKGARSTWRRPEAAIKSPVVFCSFSGGSSSSTGCSFKPSADDGDVRVTFSDASPQSPDFTSIRFEESPIESSASDAPSSTVLFDSRQHIPALSFSDCIDAFESTSTDGQMFSTSDD